MFCSNCGTQISQGQKFCPNCGQPVISNNSSASTMNSENHCEYSSCQTIDNSAIESPSNPSLTFGEAISKSINDICNLEGRSRRSEYWWMMLAVFLASIPIGFIPFLRSLLPILSVLAIAAVTMRRLHDVSANENIGKAFLSCNLALAIVTCINNLAFVEKIRFIRRFVRHSFLDDAIPSLLVILGSVSFILGIIVIVYAIKDSEKGINKWGGSPKYMK